MSDRHVTEMRIRTSKILFDVLAELNIIVVASIYPAAVADHPGAFTERNSPVLGGAVVIEPIASKLSGIGAISIIVPITGKTVRRSAGDRRRQHVVLQHDVLSCELSSCYLQHGRLATLQTN
ncbi:hypothetical protein D3C76_1294310 [compost metagenome]